jgi:6-pyruvoyltetrahydropterin/6-carboxytetrahydropterin synthase
MNHVFACNNYHGHTYLYELTFTFENTENIGYAIDFKEIKRIGVQWMLIYLDHGFVANPDDVDIINIVKTQNMKLYVMCLNGEKYCNPTVENMAKEIFLAMQLLFEHMPGLYISNLRLYETPNNFTDCNIHSITEEESLNFKQARASSIYEFVKQKGTLEYDISKGTGGSNGSICRPE